MRPAVIADLLVFSVWVLACSAVLIWRSSKTPLLRQLLDLVSVSVAINYLPHAFRANPTLLKLGYLQSFLFFVRTLQTLFVSWSVV
jgi:hypothetical protein